MAIDVSTPRSRRSLLAHVMGGAAAAVAATVAGTRNVLAAGDDGQIINVGDQFSNVQSETRLINNTNDTNVLSGINNQAGAGVVGASFTGRGVEGLTGGGGVAVYGEAGGNNGTGVQGTAIDTGGTAVRGRTTGHHSQVAVLADGSSGNGEGMAVLGRTRNGIALYGEVLDTGGHALQAVGRAVFSRSGKVTFSQGQASKTITGHAITPASLVVATIQGNVAGTWVRGVVLNDGANTFAIKLNKPAPSALVVGWFVVN